MERRNEQKKNTCNMLEDEDWLEKNDIDCRLKAEKKNGIQWAMGKMNVSLKNEEKNNTLIEE